MLQLSKVRTESLTRIELSFSAPFIIAPVRAALVAAVRFIRRCDRI
jgi:ABC-type proline/glycine betaine transport system permease subunit